MAKGRYEIVVLGPVGELLSAELEGFEVVSETADETTLRGWVVDQSGLHGVLDRIAGLGLQLSRVAPVDTTR